MEISFSVATDVGISLKFAKHEHLEFDSSCKPRTLQRLSEILRKC